MKNKTFNKIYKRANERVHHFVFLDNFRTKNLRLTLWQRLLISLSIFDFKRCIKHIPNHWPSMFLLGKIYQRINKFEIALNWFEKAYSIEKNNIDVLREASLSCLHIHNIDSAIYYSAESLKLDSTNHTLLANHAMNLLIGHYDGEAKEYIQKALKINPENEINRNINQVIESVIDGKMRRITCKDAVK
jgi:tetratricopeptide (TPR) repeat protein